MSQSSYSQAMFTGLVYDEDGNLVQTVSIGSEPHYVIMDDDFKRHVAAETVDRQVMKLIQEQAMANKDMVTKQIMGMLGQDDLFTKAMIDSSIGNIDQALEQGLPNDARTMLGMMGFRIVVNLHGDLVDVQMPGMDTPDEEW